MSPPRSSNPARAEYADLLEAAAREVADRRRWLARPWEFAFDVIGRDALDVAARVVGSGKEPVLDFAPEQRAFLAAWCDYSKLQLALMSARYGTKTFLQAIGLATAAYCDPDFSATVNAGSFAQSQILYRYFEVFLLRSDRLRACIVGEPTKTRTELRGGGLVSVLTAGPASVTGPHPKMLVLDEVCLMKPTIVDLVMGQRGAHGLVRATSTPYARFHPFHDWMQPGSGWETFQWGRRKILDARTGEWEPTFPWDSRQVIEAELATQPGYWVQIHIDGQFGSAVGTILRPEDVEASEIADPLRRPVPEGVAQADLDPLYVEDAVVATRHGVDWGFQAPTVVVAVQRLQVPNWRELGMTHPDLYYVVSDEAYTTAKEGADKILGRIEDIVRAWPGDVYMDAENPHECQRVARSVRPLGHAAHAIPFSRDKMGMVSWMQLLFERRAVRIPRRFANLLEQLYYYEWDKGKEKPKKGNDDHVDALMLALWGHRLGAGGPPGAARMALRPRRP